jgi:hypothetical protein
MNRKKMVCGIVMPISALDGYSKIHWAEVLKILREVAGKVGFEAKLVSDEKEVNVIHKRIIQNLYDNPILVCDVSGKNPNVMFELGMRLAFDKPTIIIKDEKTSISFDTGAIEHLEYPRNLKSAKIRDFKQMLGRKIQATYNKSTSDPSYTTFLKHFGDFASTKANAIHLHRTPVEAYTAVVDAIGRVDAAVNGEKNLTLCLLHGTLGNRAQGPSPSVSAGTAEHFKRFDAAMADCVKSSGRNRWNVRQFYNVTTIERLRMVRKRADQDSEGFEVRAICLPQLVPQFSPVIVDKENVFLGAIDSKGFRVDSAIQLTGNDAVRFVERYISLLWDSRLVYRLRTELGVDHSELARLSADIVSRLELQDTEKQHLRNIACGRTQDYVGDSELRAILRNLRAMELIQNVGDRAISELRDNSKMDLKEIVKLTKYGKQYVDRLDAMAT